MHVSSKDGQKLSTNAIRIGAAARRDRDERLELFAPAVDRGASDETVGPGVGVPIEFAVCVGTGGCVGEAESRAAGEPHATKRAKPAVAQTRRGPLRRLCASGASWEATV